MNEGSIKNDREECVHVAHKHLQFSQDKDE